MATIDTFSSTPGQSLFGSEVTHLTLASGRTR
jgi:hypothetical protein